MSPQLTADQIALLREAQLGHLATIGPSGYPQVTPLWIDTDGEYIIFNTAEGRVKYNNMMENPHVAISIADKKNPFRTLVAQGTVDFTDVGADAHIDKLAKKYLGVDKYPNRRPGEHRVIGRIHLVSIV